MGCGSPVLEGIGHLFQASGLLSQVLGDGHPLAGCHLHGHCLSTGLAAFLIVQRRHQLECGKPGFDGLGTAANRSTRFKLSEVDRLGVGVVDLHRNSRIQPDAGQPQSDVHLARSGFWWPQFVDRLSHTFVWLIERQPLCVAHALGHGGGGLVATFANSSGLDGLGHPVTWPRGLDLGDLDRDIHAGPVALVPVHRHSGPRQP